MVELKKISQKSPSLDFNYQYIISQFHFNKINNFSIISILSHTHTLFYKTSLSTIQHPYPNFITHTKIPSPLPLHHPYTNTHTTSSLAHQPIITLTLTHYHSSPILTSTHFYLNFNPTPPSQYRTTLTPFQNPPNHLLHPNFSQPKALS